MAGVINVHAILCPKVFILITIITSDILGNYVMEMHNSIRIPL